jgi:hypothetical protein
MRMAVDSAHGDDAAHEAFRDVDHRGASVDIKRPSSNVDRSEPLEQRDREECFNELRAQHMRAGSRDAKDEPEHASDGGWKWKGLELDPVANKIADRAIAARREAEGRDAEGNYEETGITPAMRRIEAELEHGTLVPDTEKFALKSPDRFKEKLAKLIERRPDESAADLAAQIHDGIRYTFTFDAALYADGVGAVCAKVESAGCDLTRLANRWDGEDYKGINSRWRHAESGQYFEVQFHTQESWEAKQANHDAYEKINDPTTDIDEVELLRAYQHSVTRSITMPDRWKDIEDYQQPGS